MHRALYCCRRRLSAEDEIRPARAAGGASNSDIASMRACPQAPICHIPQSCVPRIAIGVDADHGPAPAPGPVQRIECLISLNEAARRRCNL
jgi:hypothetical protein